MDVRRPEAVTERGSWAVDFWLDPSCPLTWITSRWLVLVAAHRPVTVRWRVMSLTILNEGKEVDPEGWLRIPARIAAAVQTEHGHDALGAFHEALWTRPDGSTGDWIGDLGDALDRAGLHRDLAETGTTTRYDAALQASHDSAISQLHSEVGTPILQLTGPDGPTAPAFGPVVAGVPELPEALRLWDGLTLVTGVPDFRELKR